jgi:hypothetical protein
MRPEEAEEMDAMDEKIGSLQCRLARAQKERDAARATIAELETALEPIVCHWDADDEGKIHPALIDAARAALAKAKGGTT